MPVSNARFPFSCCVHNKLNALLRASRQASFLAILVLNVFLIFRSFLLPSSRGVDFLSPELPLLFSYCLPFVCHFYMPVPGDKSDFIEESYKAHDEPESAHCKIRATPAVRINYKIIWRVFASGHSSELLNAV
jgi:hypothetical protein